MKTTISTIVFSLALLGATGVTAQTGSTVSKPMADTVMLSEFTDGNYTVRRLIVNNRSTADYAVRYAIGRSSLTPSLDGNRTSLDALDRLIRNIDKDSLIKIEAVTVVGYASPDGPRAMNEQLAERRAQDIQSYIDKQYGWAGKYRMSVKAVAYDWNAAIPAVEKSGIDDKQWVVNTLGRDASPMTKERELKSMPAIWSYLADNILPSMRRAEIWVKYKSGTYFETRTPMPATESEAAPQCCSCSCMMLIESQTEGIIIEMNDPGVD